MFRRKLIGACALALLATGCPDLGEEPREWTLLGGGSIDGGIWGFVLGPDQQPVVSTLGGLRRWDGQSWARVPTEGLQYITDPRFDSTGALYVRANHGTLWRRPAGATAWESFGGDWQVQVMLVEASDGVLYVGTDDLQVLYREPGAAAWSPTGYTYDQQANYQLVPDDDGNVWAQSRGFEPIRIKRTAVTTFPSPYDGVGAVRGHNFLAVEDGVIYGGSRGYTERNGFVFTHDVVTGQWRALTDGRCEGGAPLVCDRTSPAEGGYVEGIQRDSNGDVYEIWAGNNGAYPYLLRLRNGETVWEQVEDLGVPWQFGNGGLWLHIGRDRKYIVATLFTGSFNPGDGSVDPGGFWGHVYPL
jgi:hypothetical protein